jgi:hypothetical protein
MNMDDIKKKAFLESMKGSDPYKCPFCGELDISILDKEDAYEDKYTEIWQCNNGFCDKMFRVIYTVSDIEEVED